MYKIILTIFFFSSTHLSFGQFPPIDTYFFPQDNFVEVETWSYEKSEKTKLFTDSTLINYRKYDKHHNLTEYRNYFDGNLNSFDREIYSYDANDNLINTYYFSVGKRNACAYRKGMYPAKKIEIGNEKGQLVEMIIIDHNQDSLTYKFNYDNRELL